MEQFCTSFSYSVITTLLRSSVLKKEQSWLLKRMENSIMWMSDLLEWLLPVGICRSGSAGRDLQVGIRGSGSSGRDPQVGIWPLPTLQPLSFLLSTSYIFTIHHNQSNMEAPWPCQTQLQSIDFAFCQKDWNLFTQILFLFIILFLALMYHNSLNA